MVLAVPANGNTRLEVSVAPGRHGGITVCAAPEQVASRTITYTRRVPFGNGGTDDPNIIIGWNYEVVQKLFLQIPLAML